MSSHTKLALAWLGLLLILALLLLLLALSGRIRIDSNLFSLLPKQESSPQILAANEHIATVLNQRLFILIDAPTAETSRQYSRAVLEQFSSSTLWGKATPPAQIEIIGQRLYAHRAGLLAHADQEALRQHDYDLLTEAALSQLFSPAWPVTATTLAQDPLLLFPRYLFEKQQASSDEGSMTLDDGWPIRQHNGRHYRLMWITLTDSPYDLGYQRTTAAWLSSLPVNLSLPDNVRLAMTGSLLYATAGTNSAKGDISVIGLGSSLGLIVLVWLSFRSFRPLLTEFAAVSAGCLAAFVLTHLLYGSIHWMTLVFGASLIGACVNFSFYYLFMQAHHRHESGWKTMSSMLPHLLLGLITTLASYLCLLLTPFPGLRQIAFFSIVGFCGAWITSVLLLPHLQALHTDRASRYLAVFERWRRFFLAHRTWRYTLITVVLIASLAGLSQFRSDDDIRSLQAVNPTIKADEDSIKLIFGQQHAASRYFLVTGEDEDNVALREQGLLQALAPLRDSGAIGQIQALGQWLPSTALQRERIALLKAIPQQVLHQYASTIGLEPSVLDQWQRALDPDTILTAQNLAPHPLLDLRTGEQGRIVLVRDIRDEERLHELAASLEGLSWQHPVAELSTLFGNYRKLGQYRLFAAWLALSLLLTLYFGWRALPSLMLPVALALSASFALQAIAGVPINLFSIMAAFLTLGIGIDFAIFFRHTAGHIPVVSFALFICMLATILGFGLLALSATQAIRAFGLTVLLGVIFSYLFANLLTLPAQKREDHV